MVEPFVKVLSKKLLRVSLLWHHKNNYVMNLTRLSVSTSNSSQLLALYIHKIILMGAIGTKLLNHLFE